MCVCVCVCVCVCNGYRVCFCVYMCLVCVFLCVDSVVSMYMCECSFCVHACVCMCACVHVHNYVCVICEHDHYTFLPHSDYKGSESRRNESEDDAQTITRTHHTEGSQLPETRSKPPKRTFLSTSKFQGRVTNELVRRQSTHSTATPDSMARMGYSETPVESHRLPNAPGRGSKHPHSG